MNRILDIETLKQLYSKNHTKGKVTEVLPFTTHSKYSHSNWTQMIGELVKQLTKIEVNYQDISKSFYETNYNDLSIYIANQVECENEDIREDLSKFIDSYLFNDSNVNTVHPFLFNFVANGKSKSEESKYAGFTYDVFYSNSDVDTFSKFFNTREANDILNETIITALCEKVGQHHKLRNAEYTSLLEDLPSLYIEDMKYLMRKPGYFNEIFSLFTNYYIFAYCCQIIYNFGELQGDHYNDTKAFYYSLEWESLRNSRQAANGQLSYKRIQERSTLLFPHMHAQFQISHSSFNPEKENGLREFLTYSALKKKIDENIVNEEEFILNLNDWIKTYSANWKLELPNELPTDLPGSLRLLVSCIEKGMNSSAIRKFGKNIENLGKGLFLKSRGNLGYVFNLSHDLLMALITVSVKDDRLPLKSLYSELEKRGIALDFSSKRELVNMLETHNLLDKKSDSGDAQYVKPIQ